jgi:Tfp pilus assembly PilM family ATPase
VFDKLLKPRLPACAAGLENDAAAVVQLERARGGYVIKRAASLDLSANVIQPNFSQSNLPAPEALATTLSDLVTSAGLLRQRKWSVTLPEATTRSAILTIEGGGTRHEIEEVLQWKIERNFGAPASELRIAREPLSPNDQKQARYLVTAVHLSVLAEYESVFAALGWQAGLLLPRHVGEEQWLRQKDGGDGLLLSAHAEGFTAVLLRNNRPLTLRTVFCETEECEDELHRVLLFYRERLSENGNAASVSRLMVLGDRLDKNRVAEIAQETLGVNLTPLRPADVGLTIPGDLPFDSIAAPAGAARLAW